MRVQKSTMKRGNGINRVLQAIRQEGKFLFDNIRNEKLKQNLLQAIPFWLASVATGVIAVAYARLFLYAEEATRAVYHYHKALLFVLTPLCFITSWWMTKRWAPYAAAAAFRR